MDEIGAKGLWDLIPPAWQPYVGLIGILVWVASNIAHIPGVVKNQGALIPRIINFLANNWDKAFPKKPALAAVPAPPAVVQVVGKDAASSVSATKPPPFAGG